jgi:hypothetical protein
MSFFGDLFGTNASRNAREAQQAAEARAAAIKAANDKTIETGYQNTQGLLNQQRDLFRPLSEMGMGSMQRSGNAFEDALGLNGADGNTRAVGMFQASPGFNFARDQALEGTTRRMNSMGMLGSGNTLTALQDRGTQLANQEYGSWLDRLGQNRQFGAGLASQGVAGQAQSLGNLAGLEQWNVAAKTGNLNQAGNNMNAANQFGFMGTQAASQGAANALGGGISLARLAAQMAGGLDFSGFGGGGFKS